MKPEAHCLIQEKQERIGSAEPNSRDNDINVTSHLTHFSMLSSEIFKLNNSKFVQSCTFPSTIHHAFRAWCLKVFLIPQAQSVLLAFFPHPHSFWWPTHGCPFIILIFCFHFSGHSSSFTTSSKFYFLYSQTPAAWGSMCSNSPGQGDWWALDLSYHRGWLVISTNEGRGQEPERSSY